MTDEERADLTAKLVEARDALHQVALGAAVVSVRNADGREVQFNRASMPQLRAYVQELEGMLGQGGRRGPLRPRFR